MFDCTYTKDKLKKAKLWMDGFITINGSMVYLYNEEKKRIYSSKYNYLAAELILPGYIIYCEKIVKPAEESCEYENLPIEESNKTLNRNTRDISYKVNRDSLATKNGYLPPKKKYGQQEKIIDGGIILIDEGSGFEKTNLNTKPINSRLKGRTNQEILLLLNNINKNQ